MLLNTREIMEILPHRNPFLLVDCVESMEPRKKIVAYKNVTMNEPYFQGHFPGHPVMPGVLIVEALAQAGSIAALSVPENKGKIGYFGGINNCRFKKVVEPGDVLRLEVEMTKVRGPVGMGVGTAYVGDQIACKCEITFIIGD